MTSLDALAAWLQEQESYHAERALKLTGVVSMRQEAERAATTSRAYEAVLLKIWELEPPVRRFRREGWLQRIMRWIASI